MINTVSVFGTLPETIRLSSLIRLLVSIPNTNIKILSIGKRGNLRNQVLESSASSPVSDLDNKKDTSMCN